MKWLLILSVLFIIGVIVVAIVLTARHNSDCSSSTCSPEVAAEGQQEIYCLPWNGNTGRKWNIYTDPDYIAYLLATGMPASEGEPFATLIWELKGSPKCENTRISPSALWNKLLWAVPIAPIDKFIPLDQYDLSMISDLANKAIINLKDPKSTTQPILKGADPPITPELDTVAVPMRNSILMDLTDADGYVDTNFSPPANGLTLFETPVYTTLEDSVNFGDQTFNVRWTGTTDGRLEVDGDVITWSNNAPTPITIYAVTAKNNEVRVYANGSIIAEKLSTPWNTITPSASPLFWSAQSTGAGYINHRNNSTMGSFIFTPLTQQEVGRATKIINNFQNNASRPGYMGVTQFKSNLIFAINSIGRKFYSQWCRAIAAKRTEPFERYEIIGRGGYSLVDFLDPPSIDKLESFYIPNIAKNMVVCWELTNTYTNFVNDNGLGGCFPGSAPTDVLEYQKLYVTTVYGVGYDRIYVASALARKRLATKAWNLPSFNAGLDYINVELEKYPNEYGGDLIIMDNQHLWVPRKTIPVLNWETIISNIITDTTYFYDELHLTPRGLMLAVEPAILKINSGSSAPPLPPLYTGAINDYLNSIISIPFSMRPIYANFYNGLNNAGLWAKGVLGMIPTPTTDPLLPYNNIFDNPQFRVCFPNVPTFPVGIGETQRHGAANDGPQLSFNEFNMENPNLVSGIAIDALTGSNNITMIAIVNSNATATAASIIRGDDVGPVLQYAVLYDTGTGVELSAYDGTPTEVLAFNVGKYDVVIAETDSSVPLSSITLNKKVGGTEQAQNMIVPIVGNFNDIDMFSSNCTYVSVPTAGSTLIANQTQTSYAGLFFFRDLSATEKSIAISVIVDMYTARGVPVAGNTISAPSTLMCMIGDSIAHYNQGQLLSELSNLIADGDKKYQSASSQDGGFDDIVTDIGYYSGLASSYSGTKDIIIATSNSAIAKAIFDTRTIGVPDTPNYGPALAQLQADLVSAIAALAPFYDNIYVIGSTYVAPEWYDAYQGNSMFTTNNEPDYFDMVDDFNEFVKTIGGATPIVFNDGSLWLAKQNFVSATDFYDNYYAQVNDATSDGMRSDMYVSTDVMAFSPANLIRAAKYIYDGL